MSKDRVLRSSSYCTNWGLRTTYRVGVVPEDQDGKLGFRIVVRRRKP